MQFNPTSRTLQKLVSPNTLDAGGGPAPEESRHTAQKNVFIIGMDDFNERILSSMPGTENLKFHSLFRFEDFKGLESYPYEDILKKADARLREFDGTIDAITGFWDFPICSMVPVLAERFGCPATSPASEVKCEHKYWSRLLQREAVSEVCPEFQAVNPFDENVAEQVEIPKPFFIKPVKGTSSALGYLIKTEAEFQKALAEIREGISSISDAFRELLDHVHTPDRVKNVHGEFCIVEELMTGVQCTVCGYVTAHQVHIYGIVDSLTYEDTSVFQRLQYPSKLPHHATQRMETASRKIMEYLGYNDAAFNVEFFYDPDRDKIGILEINPRISQSHGMVFGYVDGKPDHALMVDLALGKRPDWPRGEGPHAIAAKWYYRKFEDAHVNRVPTEEEIREIEKNEGCLIKIIANEGEDLHELDEQDPNAYDLAFIWMGDASEEDLEKKYERVVERLHFEFSEPATTA